MIRAGAVLDVVGIVLTWVALRVLCPRFGLCDDPPPRRAEDRVPP